MLLVAFNIFPLSLIFVSSINTCLGMLLLGFMLYGTLCSYWTWVRVSFPILEKFSAYNLNYFLGPFVSFPSETPIRWMLVCLMLSQRFLRLSSFLFIVFSLFCSTAVISNHLFFRSLIHSSASFILLLIPSSVFFFHFIYCIVYLILFVFQIFSLLKFSSIFSVCESILLRSWIIFTVIALNSFSSRLPISTSLSSGVLFRSFIWNILLCYLILSNFLWLSSFHRLQDDSCSCFWCLPHGGAGVGLGLVCGGKGCARGCV